jgi:hypothetical protein
MSAKFVMCIDNKSHPIDLTLHKVYRILPDEKGEKHGWIRIVDDTGEDYLYPARKFVPVQIPEEAERSFDLEVAQPQT